MSDTIRCPDCGHENPPGLDACAACGFPLDAEATARVGGTSAPVAPTPAPAGGEPAESPAPAEEIFIPRPIRRPLRPRANRANMMSTSLWLIFGSIAAIAVIGVAVKTNVDRASQPVEGSTPVQQASADSLLAAIQRDSTDVGARVRLADLLYDTANWPEAIVQYRAAIRMDSSLVGSIVDLGVCYYTLGEVDEAERHFLLALNRDPHHPVATFNLGIVHERRKDFKRALDYFHRALRSEPPEEMKQAVMAAMARIQEEQKLKPGPLTP
jgi:cytochrome c-type biogenesis protein CcmH/NrfG